MVDAVIALSTQPNGFAVAQVAEMVRARARWSPTKYSVRNAAYDLAKLGGNKLNQRRKRSRRYTAEPGGMRTICAYLLLREKVIKPLLAGVIRPMGRPPKIVSALDQHYVKPREELHRTFETIGLAA